MHCQRDFKALQGTLVDFKAISAGFMVLQKRSDNTQGFIWGLREVPGALKEVTEGFKVFQNVSESFRSAQKKFSGVSASLQRGFKEV